MPIYEYECAACGTPFEVRLSYAEADSADPACPRCGKARARRKIGRVQVRRGQSSGWLTRDQMMTAAGMADAAQSSQGSDPGHEDEHKHDHDH